MCYCVTVDNGSFVTTSSPHVKSLLPAGAHDLLALPSEGITELSWQQHNKSQPLSLVGRNEQLVITPTVMQPSHPSGVDMTLNKKVTTVQAYIRGHLTRKHINPFKVQTKAVVTIQAHW